MVTDANPGNVATVTGNLRESSLSYRLFRIYVGVSYVYKSPLRNAGK